MKPLLLYLALGSLMLLSACVTTPEFDTRGVNRTLTPASVARAPAPAIGETVIWGGMILSIRNLTDRTQLEILAYPLDSRDRPKPDAEPIGRFILTQRGYLEPAEYAAGRFVSLRGRITGSRRGKIDETDYRYPVVEAEKLFLWSKQFQEERPRIHFGFGVIIAN
jgi:outer membrane lipoprotein